MDKEVWFRQCSLSRLLPSDFLIWHPKSKTKQQCRGIGLSNLLIARVSSSNKCCCRPTFPVFLFYNREVELGPRIVAPSKLHQEGMESSSKPQHQWLQMAEPELRTSSDPEVRCTARRASRHLSVNNHATQTVRERERETKTHGHIQNSIL